MERSESIANIATALAIAQGVMESALADSIAVVKHKEGGGQHSYKYADLSSVVKVVRKPLSENGIAVVQTTEPANGGSGVAVRTMLAHKSGEWMASTIAVNCGNATPQAIGSAITYARRYGLAAICGVVQEDDDAQEASRPNPADAKRAREVPRPPAVPPAGPGNEDVRGAVIDWLRVNREDVQPIVAQIKKRVGIDGPLEQKDIPKVLNEIKALREKGVTLETLNDALSKAA